MQVDVGRAQQEQEPGGYCYDGAAGHHRCYRSLFSQAAIDGGVARCAGSVYGALRGARVPMGSVAPNTSLQSLALPDFGVGRPDGSPGAPDGSLLVVSRVRAGRQVVGAGKRRFRRFFEGGFAVALHASGF